MMRLQIGSVFKGLSLEKICDSDCVGYLSLIWRHFFGDNSVSPFPPLTVHCLWPRLGPSGLWILHNLDFDKSVLSMSPVRCPRLTVVACVCVEVGRCCSSRIVASLGGETTSSSTGKPWDIQGQIRFSSVFFLFLTCGHGIRVVTAIVLAVEGAVVVPRPGGNKDFDLRVVSLLLLFLD